MSQENVELLRQAYSAFAQGDSESMAKLAGEYLHPDFELETTFVGHVFRGLDGLQEYINEVRENLGYTPGPEEFIDLGHKVVVVLRVTGRGAGSGVSFTAQVATVWTIDGRAVHAKAFGSRDEALQAARLSE